MCPYLVREEVHHVLAESRGVLCVELREAGGQDVLAGEEVVVAEADGVDVHIQLVQAPPIHDAVDVATVKLPHHRLHNDTDGVAQLV